MKRFFRGLKTRPESVPADVASPSTIGGEFDALLGQAIRFSNSGNLADAAPLLRQAIALRPDALDALAHLALVLQHLALWPEARDVLGRILALRPDWDQAHNLLGIVLGRLGDRVAAMRAFEQAVTLNPASIEALNNLANVVLESGDAARAADLYRDGLRIHPGAATLLVNLGLAQRQLGLIEEAARAFEQAVERDPDMVDAWVNLGATRSEGGDATAAEQCFRQALARQPQNPTARANLALCLAQRGAIQEAIEHLDLLQSDGSASPDLLATIVEAERHCGRLDVAERLLDHAMKLRPDDPQLVVARGMLLQARGAVDDAQACFRAALDLDANQHGARYNLATLRLLQGDYREGFGLYESRFDAFRLDASRYRGVDAALGSQLRWRGEALAGRRLLLWAEQGLGDSIMMLRYLPRLDALDAAVVVACDARMVRLVEAIEGSRVVLPRNAIANPPPYDVHCPFMSLPHRLGTTAGSVPPPAAFHLPADEVEAWRRRFANDARPRVGVVWRGGAALRDDHLRNVPFALFDTLLSDPAIRFVSLQMPRAERHEALTDWMDECDDLLDTACLVKSLHLVITVDTAVAHLAGSMGTPTWLLNRHGSEWRWGLEAERTVWYPSMRIFRQDRAGDWAPTVARVAQALRAGGTSLIATMDGQTNVQ